ncbi:MAG TPA: hypothetical protein VF581_00760 [Flavobacterium sp.]|jgi:antitoxin component YwqK of YwqJK toxin-antitoxin module
MNYLYFVILFLVFSVSSNAQSSDGKSYLDDKFKLSNKEHYAYLQEVKDFKYTRAIYEVMTYYKSGKLFSKGLITDKVSLTRTGEYTMYYENGSVKEKKTYERNAPVGGISEWYDDGRKKIEGEYLIMAKDKPRELKINQFWNRENVQKVIDGNGAFEDRIGKTYSAGSIKNGFKDSTWTGYDEVMKYSYNESYSKRELVSGISTDSLGVVRSYKVVEKFPEPNNGLAGFYNHVQRNIVPMDAKSFKLLIKFKIDENGEVTNIAVANAPNQAVAHNIEQVLMSYGKWTAGEIRGIKKSVDFSLPIVYGADLK